MLTTDLVTQVAYSLANSEDGMASKTMQRIGLEGTASFAPEYIDREPSDEDMMKLAMHAQHILREAEDEAGVHDAINSHAIAAAMTSLLATDDPVKAAANAWQMGLAMGYLAANEEALTGSLS